MKKLLMVLPMMFALAACGNESKIKDAVRQKLKDPESAQFKFIDIDESGTKACTIWNARNSMGGYGDWRTAKLRKDESAWEVMTLEGGEKCQQNGFKAIYLGKKAGDEARRKAIQKIQAIKNISYDEALKIATSYDVGNCRTLVLLIEIDSEGLAKDQILKDESGIKFYGGELKRHLDYLDKMDCGNPGIL